MALRPLRVIFLNGGGNVFDPRIAFSRSIALSSTSGFLAKQKRTVEASGFSM